VDQRLVEVQGDREPRGAASRRETDPAGQLGKEGAMVTVSGKALGRKRPLFADYSVALPPDLGGDGDRLTLRRLITAIVRSEVEAFRTRQAERKLLRALTARQIEEGAGKGKIDFGGRELDQKVDAEATVAAALQAFEDGLYLVVVDGEEHRELDREVFLGPDTRVTFVRLTLLAGG
jgi:hypothetical protein